MYAARMAESPPRSKRKRRRNPDPSDATTRIMRRKPGASPSTSNILRAVTDKARVLERRRVLNQIAPFLSTDAFKRRSRANPRRAAATSPQGTVPMAKKKRRSAAQRAATATMHKANRARRAGRTAKPKARRTKKRRARSTVTRRRRAVARVSRRTTRRRSRRLRVRNVPASSGTVVVVRKVRRGSVRRASRRAGRRFRSVRVNPGVGALFMQGPHSFVGGLTGIQGNLKAAMSGGLKGYLYAAGGAVGAVAVGTVLRRAVFGMAMKVAPNLAAGAIGARVLSFASYYGAGWAIARFAIKDSRTKSAVIAGSAIAALVEVLRPGTVASLVARIPVLGPMIAGRLAGIDADLGSYVEDALGENTALMDPSVVDGDCGFGVPESLGAYALGEYSAAVDGVECDTMQEMVSTE
jgi:hypothetical protein